MRSLSRHLAGLLVATASLSAQFPATSATNAPIANASGDQAVPKLAVTADGGSWIAWFDGSVGGYAVRIQRLDRNGYEQFPHNGLLVSSNPQSTSLVDWDLITDSSGNAVLTFTDTRAGGDLDVYAYRISPSGQFLWGANGIALSNDAHYEANPVVAEMTDGSFVFAWMRSVTGAVARLGVQRLDPSGLPQLGANGIEIFGGTTDDPGFVGIVPSVNGHFILTWIRDITPFSAPRHLWAQRYDSAGTPQWGTAPVQVFNSSALPIAYKPDMIPDGSGGAWLAWHVSVGSFYQSRVQRLDAAGAEVFAHNGVEISLEPNRSDFNPSIVPLAGTGDVIVFYNKRDAGQAQWGIGGQRVTATGSLAWGTNGIEYVPFDSTVEEVPRAVATSNGAMCFVEQGVPGQNAGVNGLVGFRVDGAGTPLWTPTVLTVAATPSGKDKLRVAPVPGDGAVLVWNDSRTDINDVYAQSVRGDGGLGPLPASFTAYGCGLNPSNSLTLVGGAPSIGGGFSLAVVDPTASFAPGASTFLALAALPPVGFPCGIPLGNTGMAPGTTGELLVDLGTLLVPLIGGSPYGTTPSTFGLTVPALPWLVGIDVFSQAAVIDAAGRVGLTQGGVIHIGP